MLKLWFDESSKIAITGYKGFIGNHVVSYFPQGIEIDFEDLPNSCRIIHLAASAQNNIETFKRNLELDNIIFDFSCSKNHQIILASSNNVYPLKQGCNSHTDFYANDYYSLSKISSEFVMRDIFKLNGVAVRIPDVFGKGQRYGNFFKGLETAIRNKSDIKIFGSIYKIRSYIHVKELSNFICFLARQNFDGFNVATYVYPEAITLLDIARFVAEKSNQQCIVLEDKIIESSSDTRTMLVEKSSGYKPVFNNLYDALEYYVESIIYGDSIK